MDANTGRHPPAHVVPWLINQPFTLLLAGQSLSVLGDFFFDTTLMIWIAASIARHQSWAPAAVSGLLLATSVPTVAVGSFAGVFVDRWGRRRIMLVCDALRAALVTALVVGSGLLPIIPSRPAPLVQLGAIYATVILSTACGQFFLPARSALLQEIVPPDSLPQASGYSQIAMPIAMILAPPIAAPLFFALGPVWALLANAASFLVSFAAVWLVRVVPSREPIAREANFSAELREGVTFVAGNRVLMAVLTMAVIAMLGAGAMNALDVFFVRQNLHASLSSYGALSAGFGAGFLAGAILAPQIITRLGLLRSFWLAPLVASLMIIGYARADSFLSGLIMILLVGFPIAVLNVAAQPIILRATPSALIGRVEAILNPAISLATMVSIALAGFVDSTLLRGFHARVLGVTFGPVDTIFTVSGALTLVGAICAWLALREAQLPVSSEV